MSSNLPPPDELAQVREQIKALQVREAELRHRLITTPSERTGAAWLATIKNVTQSRTDLKELRANHPDLVAEFSFPFETQTVVLSGITEDGEILPARTFRKLTEEGDSNGQ